MINAWSRGVVLASPPLSGLFALPRAAPDRDRRWIVQITQRQRFYPLVRSLDGDVGLESGGDEDSRVLSKVKPWRFAEDRGVSWCLCSSFNSCCCCCSSPNNSSRGRPSFSRSSALCHAGRASSYKRLAAASLAIAPAAAGTTPREHVHSDRTAWVRGRAKDGTFIGDDDEMHLVEHKACELTPKSVGCPCIRRSRAKASSAPSLSSTCTCPSDMPSRPL